MAIVRTVPLNLPIVDPYRLPTRDFAGFLSQVQQVANNSWDNTQTPVNGNYTLKAGDIGNTVALGGNTFYQLTIGPVANYDPQFLCLIVNIDLMPGGRAKKIVVTGGPTVLLWPGQSFFLFRVANAWYTAPSDPVPLRWNVPANVTLNVNASVGNDNNDGLATGAGNALATPQRAADIISGLWDINTRTVTIQVTGAVTGSIAVNSPWVGSGTVQLLGDTTTPPNTTWTNSTGNPNVIVQGAGRLQVSGFKLVNTGGGDGCAAITFGTLALVGKMEFGAVGNYHMEANQNGQISYFASAPYVISGGGNAHYGAAAAGAILISGFTGANTISITGTPAFPAGFALANQGSIAAPSNAYSGSVNNTTTPQWQILNGGAIYTGGVGAGYFPGNAALNVGGTTAGGGFIT